MKKVFLLIALMAAIFFSGPVMAENASVALEEVVVTAGRVEEDKKEVTTNIVVISQEEIKASSARDVGDLLAEKNIGHIHKYPGALTAIGIRGFRTETHGNDLRGHVLILIDGRRSGTGNLAAISTDNVERVEIIRGPGAVQYGSAGMGGVINVITKRGEGKPGFFIETGIGSYDYKEKSAGFYGESKGFDFSVAYSDSSGDEYDTGSGVTFQNTGFEDETKCSLNLGYEFAPNNRIGVTHNYFEVEHSGNAGYLSANDLDDYSDKKYESTDIIYEGATADNDYSWMGRFFFGESTDTWTDPTASDPSGYDDGVPSNRDSDQTGAQVQGSGEFGNSRLTLGADWANYEVRASWSDFDYTFDSLALFLLGKTRFMDDRLILTGGVRYDTYELDLENDSGVAQDDAETNLSVGAAYLLNDNIKFRVNYGEAFVIPDADELAADYVSGSTRYVGNPNLKPESSQTYEAGVDYTSNYTNASLTYFYTDYKDQIVSTTVGANRSWTNLNNSTISGFEGEFSFDLGAMLSWKLEVKPYVNLIFYDKYEDDASGADLLYISDINASYGVTVSDDNGFSSKLNFAYTGEQMITDYESGWPYQDIKWEGFTVANLSMSKVLFKKAKAGEISMRFEIDNLFDKDYSYVKGYPMSGRTFFAGLKYTY